MQVRTQFCIFLVNKPGVLADVTDALSGAGVNIEALSLADSGDNGLLRCICDDVDAARKVLDKHHDRWTETEVLVLEMANRPGGFAAVVRKLSEAHINISYAYATAGEKAGRALTGFKVADLHKAKEILADG